MFLHCHLFQPLAPLLQRIELHCALVGLATEPKVVLLGLLKQASQLEHTLLLLVLHLVGLAKASLGALDLLVEDVAFFFRALDVCLELGHFDFSLTYHSFGFDDCSIDRVTLMAEVLVASLVVLDILLQHVDLPLLVLQFAFVVLAHCSEAVFKQVAALINLLNLQAQGVKVTI